VTRRLKRICEFSIYAVAGIALVCVLPLVGAAGAAVINPKTGPYVKLTLKEKYGSTLIIDSVNIYVVIDGVLRVTRAGEVMPLGGDSWAVVKVEEQI
jgi:hypothetical protein